VRSVVVVAVVLISMWLIHTHGDRKNAKAWRRETRTASHGEIEIDR
jgi:uncharacterized membrane protein